MSTCPPDKIQHVYSTRGKKLILYSNYTFYKDREIATSIKWRCTKKMCRAKLFTDKTEMEILRYESNHNHDVNKSMIRQLISNATKRKVSNRLCGEKSSEIIKEELNVLKSSGEITKSDVSYIKKNLQRERMKIMKLLPPKKKKGGTTNSADQKNADPNTSTQCSTSTSLFSSSGIVVKQEIIETEMESSMFDDPSSMNDDSPLHSSMHDGPSGAQFYEQQSSTTCSESSNSNTDILSNAQTYAAPMLSQTLRTVKVEPGILSISRNVVSEITCRNEYILPGDPLSTELSYLPQVSSSNESPSCSAMEANASCVAHSESSNSNADMHLGGQDNVVGKAPTPSLGWRTVKVESDVNSEKSCTFLSKHESRVPYPVSNVSGSKTSPSNERIQPEVLPQIGWTCSPLINISDRRSCSSDSTQPRVPSHSNPPSRSRDKFDIFGEFVASKLRNLDPKSSDFIQTTFSDLLLKAELGMFSNKSEKVISDAEIHDVGKSTQSPNEITHNSSEKENVQPRISPHLENTHLHQVSVDFQKSSDEIIEPRGQSPRTNTSLSPVPNNTNSQTELTELIQPAVSSHTENPLLPVEKVIVPENSSANSLDQTIVTVLPSGAGSYVLNTANSCSNTPIQPAVPSHMRPRDNFDAYGEFVASKLRNLDSRSCAFVQTAFADLIFKGELGRFVSEGEQNYFANRTNNLLWNSPSASNSQKTVVSSCEEMCTDLVP